MSFVEHYIDDFITVGRQGSPECQDNLETCEATGMPIWSGQAAHHSGDPPQAEGGVGGKEQESRCDNALGGPAAYATLVFSELAKSQYRQRRLTIPPRTSKLCGGLCLRPQSAESYNKALKTDPFRQGQEIFIGKTGKLCPVSAMLSSREEG